MSSEELLEASDDATNPNRLYELMAVVVHSGSGPNRGHYISLVKSHGLWLLFDDEYVDRIDPANISDFFGLSTEVTKSSDSAYILFYQACDAPQLCLSTSSNVSNETGQSFSSPHRNSKNGQSWQESFIGKFQSRSNINR